jgi:hypothetical protein
MNRSRLAGSMSPCLGAVVPFVVMIIQAEQFRAQHLLAGTQSLNLRQSTFEELIKRTVSFPSAQ